MKIFISGACGFVGSELALGLRALGHEVSGCDNFSRPGSELNRARLEAAGVDFWRGDAEQHRGRFDDETHAVGGRSRPGGDKMVR